MNSAMSKPLDLRVAKLTRGISGVDLAEKMGVSRPVISRWLLRQQPVPETRRALFAELLGIDITDLLPPNESKKS